MSEVLPKAPESVSAQFAHVAEGVALGDLCAGTVAPLFVMPCWISSAEVIMDQRTELAKDDDMISVERRAHGHDKISTLIHIDEPPKAPVYPTNVDEWGRQHSETRIRCDHHGW